MFFHFRLKFQGSKLSISRYTNGQVINIQRQAHLQMLFDGTVYLHMAAYKFYVPIMSHI